MSRYDRGAGTDVKVVLSAAMGVLRDHGPRLDRQLTLALKALAQSSAFFTQPAPPDRTFTEAALDAVTKLAEETFAGEYLAEIAKKRGIRLASRAIQEAPDYLKGLLSWRDQVKKGPADPLPGHLGGQPPGGPAAGHRGLGDRRRPGGSGDDRLSDRAGLPAARASYSRQDRPGGPSRRPWRSQSS
jgi:hypothetical protein